MRLGISSSLGGPSGGRIFDFLVKGLAELGHQVSYFLDKGAGRPLPDGVRLVDAPCWESDILHCRSDQDFGDAADRRGQHRHGGSENPWSG